MTSFLYYIFIFPLVQIIEISFAIVQRISQNNAVAIIGVSAVVTACTMPLYFIAEKWQQVERDIQKKFKPKVDKIKSVFKGDEQYMILSTYYRQNHYHPLYALRNSLGVLIQVPFFIAAYSYLSHLDAIKGVSFLFIQDLGAPDRFLSLGNFTINILPVLMTLINCASGAVYTKGLAARDKIQVYGIALVFLVLLYNSPAGLVLYWTMNNVFSLAKNVLAKTKHWKAIVFCLLCVCSLLVIARYTLLGFSRGVHGGFTANRLLVSAFFSLVFFVPLFIRLFRFIQSKIPQTIKVEQSALAANRTYILSALILFALCGLVIPGALIASSVPEFSFLDSYTTPLPFIFTASVQAAGIFLFWPLCVYFLFSKKVQYALSLIFSLVCITALVNAFLFPLNYGDISTTFRFSDPVTFIPKTIIINGFVTLGILGLFTCLLLNKRIFIIHSFQLIILAALVCFSVITIHKINKDFKQYEHLLTELSQETSMDISFADKPEPVYHFSRNGKNVIVFMLDGAISGFVPYIFEEKPELLNDFSGFTYYPNCVSFGNHTRIGMPLLFGGYEYKPENIQKNRSYATEKHNEALLMMPRIFSKQDYRITITDPTLANYNRVPDLSIFTPYPEIFSQNILGNYTNRWLNSHPDMKARSIPKLLEELLIRFSFLKSAPPVFRVLSYDRARWLKPGNNLLNNQLSLLTMDNYTTLDYLPLLTEISDDNSNTYTAMVNALPHDPVIFQFPDYVPAMNITVTGRGAFAKDDYYHPNMAALLLVGKWLRFLQEQGVYDNTRIIIASDHGRNTDSNYTGNLRLPNGSRLSSYHTLLLVKDFNDQGNLVTDTTFMTHGDVPLIAMRGLIDNPQNPFSGNPVQSDKENGILIPTTNSIQYTTKDNQWLYVRDDIFNLQNWKNVKK